MKTKTVILTVLLLLLITIDANAQCAMCKAVVETNLENGGTKGAGLNDGILYLMSIPYIAALVFGALFYLQKKKTRNSLTQ